MQDLYDDRVCCRPEHSRAVLVYHIRSLRLAMDKEKINFTTSGTAQDGSPILFDLYLLPLVSSLVVGPH